MLGACNTCLRLQSRVTSSGATFDGLVFHYFLFVFILVVVRFSFAIILYYVLFYYILYIYYLFFSMWDRVGTKDRFFHRGWGMGIEALIKKNTRVLGGKPGIIISAGQSNWEAFLFRWGVGGGEMRSCNLLVWEN